MSKDTFDPRRRNPSSNTHLSDILAKDLSRRSVLKQGAGLASLGMLSSLGGMGCSILDKKYGDSVLTRNVSKLGFESISGSLTDAVTLVSGYTASILAPWGTPLNNTAEVWREDGSNSADDQANSVGMHHDGMHFFPLNDTETDGLLCINHEFVDQKALHPSGPTRDSETNLRASTEEVRKEINAHGVSVVRIKLEGDTWSVVDNDSFNRRFTGATEMAVSGPVAKDPSLLKTKFAPFGDKVRGTLGNCGNGYTPWGTYLTCEEHWPSYFINKGERSASQDRLGVPRIRTRYGWVDLKGSRLQVDDEFRRFDIAPTEKHAVEDYRNEANGFGYVVEIDPYDSSSRAIKRTALGRFRHESCMFGNLDHGRPIVFYSGHDSDFEYMYKFVSDAVWDETDLNVRDRLLVGQKYMDEGTLYVMRCQEDGKGEWIPLKLSTEITKEYIREQGLKGVSKLGDIYATLGELILNTPGAADAVGATPMDRPEWCAVDPLTGNVYLSLTNNKYRNEKTGSNPANPRLNNKYGHILRWKEGEKPTEFVWDIFVFGAPAEGVDAASYNLSGLTESNQFGSPDGLFFDKRGILWIQTDNSADELKKLSNDQMLAVIPSSLTGHGERPDISSENESALRRFFVGPNGCEVTGLTMASDCTSFFANIQHPKNWPYRDDATAETPSGINVRPRSATVVFRKKDGGPVGE